MVDFPEGVNWGHLILAIIALVFIIVFTIYKIRFDQCMSGHCERSCPTLQAPGRDYRGQANPRALTFART